jgi:predicted transcriptional regulator
MSNLSLRLPDSLHEKVRELAARDHVSINQFISTAVAEKAAALLTVEYLAERAGRGSAAAFDRILARVPERPPDAGDAIEPRGAGRKRPAKRRRRR